MKITRILLVLLVICSLFVVACGGKKKGSDEPKKVWEPSWYGEQNSSEYVFTYGNAIKQAQRTAEESARAQAMAEAAAFVEQQVQSMTKDFISEAGVGANTEVVALTEQVTKMVANTKFAGVMPGKREVRQENGMYKCWIQLQIPKADINRSLQNAIQREESLYNQFRASQSFQELERAVQNY
jgi:hypothetical protein